MKKKLNDIGNHSTWATPLAHRFAIRAMRAELASLTPAGQADKLERVRELLDKEQARGQRQPSALAQLAPEAYGIEVSR